MSSTAFETERRLPLKGASNFRDLGGYEAADGRRVKWRHLFRSDALGGLTDDDHGLILDLNLRVIVDFRRDEERADNFTRLPEKAGVEFVHLNVGPKRDDSKLYAYLASGDASPEDVAEAMKTIYRSFITEYGPAYSLLLERTAAGHMPLLFHCAAGKDRTGFAAALILRALGVSEDEILADYELTNEYYSRDIRQKYPNLPSPELFHTMLAANPDYLHASFQQIDESFGDFERYLKEGLNFSDDHREQMRALLLE